MVHAVEDKRVSVDRPGAHHAVGKLRDRNMSNGRTGESDGTLEERIYYCYCQNWRADVSAILNASGKLVEWVKYSAYGTPIALPAGDTDSDGDWDATDSANITTAIFLGSPYNVRNDANLDGSVTSADITHANSITGSYQTLGRGVLSSTAVANRKAYAGYENDGAIVRFYHVRYRVLDTVLGRWTRRDPLGYVDGPNQFGYAANAPVVALDPAGLCARCNGPFVQPPPGWHPPMLPPRGSCQQELSRAMQDPIIMQLLALVRAACSVGSMFPCFAAPRCAPCDQGFGPGLERCGGLTFPPGEDGSICVEVIMCDNAECDVRSVLEHELHHAYQACMRRRLGPDGRPHNSPEWQRVVDCAAARGCPVEPHVTENILICGEIGAYYCQLFGDGPSPGANFCRNLCGQQRPAAIEECVQRCECLLPCCWNWNSPGVYPPISPCMPPGQPPTYPAVPIGGGGGVVTF